MLALAAVLLAAVPPNNEQHKVHKYDNSQRVPPFLAGFLVLRGFALVLVLHLEQLHLVVRAVHHVAHALHEPVSLECALIVMLLQIVFVLYAQAAVTHLRIVALVEPAEQLLQFASVALLLVDVAEQREGIAQRRGVGSQRQGTDGILLGLGNAVVQQLMVGTVFQHGGLLTGVGMAHQRLGLLVHLKSVFGFAQLVEHVSLANEHIDDHAFVFCGPGVRQRVVEIDECQLLFATAGI